VLYIWLLLGVLTLHLLAHSMCIISYVCVLPIVRWRSEKQSLTEYRRSWNNSKCTLNILLKRLKLTVKNSLLFTASSLWSRESLYLYCYYRPKCPSFSSFVLDGGFFVDQDSLVQEWDLITGVWIWWVMQRIGYS